MKITESSEVLSSKKFKTDDNEVVGDVSDHSVNEINKNLFQSKKLQNKNSKNLTNAQDIQARRKPFFLIFSAKKAFNYLQ